MRPVILLGFICLISFASLSDAEQPLVLPNPIQSDTPPSTTPVPNYELENLIYTIQIDSPEDQATFQNADQSITVNVIVTPPLKANDKVVVSVDNVDVAESIGSPIVNLPWLARGEHTLQAKVIPEKGTIAVSDPITIYQQRTSALIRPH